MRKLFFLLSIMALLVVAACQQVPSPDATDEEQFRDQAVAGKAHIPTSSISDPECDSFNVSSCSEFENGIEYTTYDFGRGEETYRILESCRTDSVGRPVAVEYGCGGGADSRYVIVCARQCETGYCQAGECTLSYPLVTILLEGTKYEITPSLTNSPFGTRISDNENRPIFEVISSGDLRDFNVEISKAGTETTVKETPQKGYSFFVFVPINTKKGVFKCDVARTSCEYYSLADCTASKNGCDVKIIDNIQYYRISGIGPGIFGETG